MAHQDTYIRDSGPATLTDLLTARARLQPDDMAFAFLADGVTVKDSVTYAELHCRARHIAGWLRARGVGNEPVLLLYPPGLDFIAAFFGCLYAGSIAVPAYPPHRNRSLDRLLAIVVDARARTVLCTDAVRASILNSFADASEIQALRWLATDSADFPATEPYCDQTITAERLAFLQYTSGSTNAPKGVMVTHGNLFHNSQLISEGFNLGSDSTSVFWLPLYHDMGLIGGVLQPLQIGRTSYLMPPAAFLSNPIRWLRAISAYRATISGGPNFAYDLCIRKVTPEQKVGLDLSCWRVAFNGAEPIHAATLERFSAEFAECGFQREALYPCYGLAEATLIVTGGAHDRVPATVRVSRPALEQNRVEFQVEARADARAGLSSPRPEYRVLVSCGAALGGQRVALVHPETLTPCPPNQPGEIWVSGPSVAQGYWRRPDETGATFRAYTASGDGPFMRTGDLGFMHEGELYITGRIKDLIILRGRNHYPHDIELTVEGSHPALRPACGAAFAVEAEGTGERLVVVYEVERSSRNAPVEEVAADLRGAVAAAHEVMVDAVVLIRPGSIPKTSSGKVQRHICKAGYLAGTLDVIGAWEMPAENAAPDAAIQAATNGPAAAVIEAWLVDRVASKLRVSANALDPREPLARYGLDSLAAVQLAGELEQWLGRPLSPVLVYDHPTIAALARFLAGDQAVEAASNTVHETRPAASEPIAVIGIGCRFPGADGPQAFWQLLRDGVDAITEVPADRWDINEYYCEDATQPGTMNTRWGGFLRDVDLFDRAFFGIAPREAERIDPQQRLLLEVTWEALEDAGQVAEHLTGRPVGVFVGISSNDYGRRQSNDPAAIDAYVGTGNALSIAANRLSYAFDFRGPSLAVDTACSSSLVAVHLACQSLRRGESELAVAAGVNLILAPELTVNFTRAGMMAPDGRCKAFDAAANGYVRSEGVGVVILKPLAQAQADGDPIYAVVRGSAINQDGRSNGLTAPNRQAQEAVLRAAYQDAGVAPADIDLIEAHGTGTSLGDPVEALALGGVLAAGRPSDRPALLGSVKTNIGHLEAAAGIAGFIKAALALKFGDVPPSLHFREPNPHIPFSELPLRVATQAQPWPKCGRPALVGVSSFGFGGTNAHVVLEAVKRSPAAKATDHGPHLVPLSARSAEALRDLARTWAGFCKRSFDAELPSLAFTASSRRSHHDHRLALTARTPAELGERLLDWLGSAPRAGTSSGRKVPTCHSRVVFVFAGQGPQWWGMGRPLLASEQVFRDALDRCDAIFRPLAGWSLVEELRSQNDLAKLDDTACVQPVLFALQVGLAALWQSWGIEPAAVVGHSLGEVAAAHVAGALSLNDAVRVVYHRGRLQQRASGRGKMAAVGLSAEESAAALRGQADELVLAAINGPRSTVWSGDPVALEEALRPLRERDVFHRVLRGQIAFHSPQMEALRGELVAALAGLTPTPTVVPFYSTVTGRLLTGGLLDAAYWGRNLREPVQFAAAADALLDDGHDLFLELGPHAVLAEPLNQCVRQRDKSGQVLSSLRRGEDDRQTLLATLGALYTTGFTPAWDNLHPAGCHVVSLPAYAWQRERCWHEGPPERVGRNGYHANGYAEAHADGHANGSSNGHQGPKHAPSDGWLVRPAWEPTAAPAEAPTVSGTWLALVDHPHIATQLTKLLRECGAANVIVATGADGFDPSDPAQCHRLVRETVPSLSDLTGVLHLAGLSAPPSDALAPNGLTAAQDRGAVGLLHLVQSLAVHGAVPRLWVVTRGAQAVNPDEPAAVAQAPLWGLGRVLVNEHPALRVTLVDLDPTPSAGDLPALVRTLSLEPDEYQLAWRGPTLFAARLVPAADQAVGLTPAIRGDATYLITGGLGGLGLQIAEWLVARGARSLVLAGRSGASATAEPVLAALRDRGANVVVARADVADDAQLAAVVNDIDLTMPPLRGVIHAAGVVDDSIALRLDRVRMWNVLAPKVLGAWHLHVLTASRRLDFFALFSSAAALLGSPGQANYAAANAFLDALAAYRRARNLPAVSVNWGPWAGKGMTARDARGDRFAQTGLGLIDPAIGLELFGQLLASTQAQVGVLPVDWSALRRSGYPLAGRQGDQIPAYFARLAGAAGFLPGPATRAPSALDRGALQNVPPDDWQPILEDQLRDEAARVLRLPAVALDVEQSLNHLGIDSLMAIELKNRIEADLGVTVPMVRFLEGTSVRELAEFLATQLVPLLGPTRSPAQSNGTAPEAALDAHAAGHLLAKLESLSDQQVDALLQELYAAEKGD